ncbi:nardilysin-like isoform X2 [Leptidea sinapis]|nr:nardilysin-like isoform X2 [Leptidea sinapis]
MADLLHSVYVADKGLIFKVSGYSQNLHLVVDLVTREMRAASGRVDRHMFEAVREVRARSYHNVLLKPHKLSQDVRMNVLIEPYISVRDKVSLIQNITLEELQDFTDRFLDKLYLQILMQGNIAWTDAIKISENVLKNIKWEGLPEAESPVIKVHQLPLGDRKLRVMSLNPASTNSIVTNYYQGEVATVNDTATLEVLMMLMEEPVFDVLRTKEQLGYSVFNLVRYTFGVNGFTITVNTQRDKFTVSHVDRRVESFLKKFSKDMNRLSDKGLAAVKQSLIQLKHTTDYELKEEANRNWREITSCEYKFQRLLIEAEAIDKVKMSDIRKWVADHFAVGNKSRFRKLSIQVVGHLPNSADNATQGESGVQDHSLQLLHAGQPSTNIQENQEEFITSIDDFKKSLPLVNTPRVELAQC